MKAEQKIQILVKQGEGYNLEFKEAFTTSIGKEMCAFANSNGGKILLGVKDDGTIIGTAFSNKIKSQIYDISRNINPEFEIDDNWFSIIFKRGSNETKSSKPKNTKTVKKTTQKTTQKKIENIYQNLKIK